MPAEAPGENAALALTLVSDLPCHSIRSRESFAYILLLSAKYINTNPMPFELLTKEVLLNAAIATSRPVALLVGAPLSVKDGAGVPGVTEILDFVRAEIRSRVPSALPSFETALALKKGGDAYQKAMSWLGENAGQDAVNEVIKKAVLMARKPGVAELPPGTNGNPDEWIIPAGTLSLGALVANASERFLGPVLTTNFDPLISLAIRTAGGQAYRHVLTADGALPSAAEVDPGVCPVVHLHGFWRDADTLHNHAQLTAPRPRLAKSLQRLLESRTLIVSAYGGWDDFFTRALIDLMHDEQAQLDVIWCFREDDADKVKAKHEKLLADVEPAIRKNRFRAYGGIDCHSIFGEILDRLNSVSTPAAVAAAAASPLAGWELIDANYLDTLRPLSAEEVVRYFDGATPTWRHAMCADIPRRAAVGEISRRLAAVRDGKSGCSLQLIRAAGGEGKSTLLLQAAAAAAASGEWNVLWRTSSRIVLPTEHVVALRASKPWLIVVDDAENLVRDLVESVSQLHARGDAHVHFLLAARDTDWRYFFGDRQPWATMLMLHQDIKLRELRNGDARLLVGSWRRHGTKGLRELASLSGADEQVAALLKAVQGTTPVRDEGSFFGGLLAVRFGPAGLRAHVVLLLTRLKDARIENSTRTLFDALLYVAACHAIGIPGIDERVLADLVEVPRDWIQTLVVNPLGEEAAAVRSAGHVFTRHSKVAAAILVAAEQDLGADIAEVWSAIVRQTVRTSVTGGVSRQTHGDSVNACLRLQRELPQQFTERRRLEIAIATAKADIAAEPDKLKPVNNLCKVYRECGDLASAEKVFRGNVETAPRKADSAEVIRSFWFEWGVVRGQLNRDGSHQGSDAWIQGLSISDHFKFAPIDFDRVKRSCNGLGEAFKKLARFRSDCPFARGMRAVAYLGRLTKPHPHDENLKFFGFHDRDGAAFGATNPKNFETSVSWLTTAVAQAGRELQDPFLKALLKPEQVSFNMLRGLFASSQLQPLSPKTHAPPRTPEKSSPENTSNPRPPLTSLEAKIMGGIERVLDEAWAAVPEDINPDERFNSARRKAADSISRLSPHIKRQVSAHFNFEKWQSLRNRDPRRNG